MTAKITMSPGGVGSHAFASSFVNTLFVLSNVDDAGVAGWRWTWLDTPQDSPTLNPPPPDSFDPTLDITPDVKGWSVQVQLTTYKDAARTIVDDVDEAVLGIRFDGPNDHLIPPAGETTQLDQPKGWSREVNRLLAFAHAGGGSGAVSSVFGRVGAVLAVAGDYVASKITNDSSVSGSTVKDALNALLAAIGASGVSSVFGRTGAVTAARGDYSADLITQNVVTATTIGAGTTNNWVVGDSTTLVRVAASAPGAIIAGMVAPTAGGANLRFVYCPQTSTNDVIILDGQQAGASGSTAANRFTIGDSTAAASQLVLSSGEGALFFYDSVVSRWVLVGYSGREATTGDVVKAVGATAATISNNAVTTAKINNAAVTLAKLADIATASFLGRTTAGTGTPEVLTATQATALLNSLVGDSGSGGTKGLVPAPGAGDAAAGKFLKADGTFAVPPGTGGAVADPATTFAWSAGAATIDVSLHHNYTASNTLAANSTLTLSNGIDGDHGIINVKQDGTGGRTLTFSISGRTVLKDLNVADTNPLATANGYTSYFYYYDTIAGTAIVSLSKQFLQ